VPAHHRAPGWFTRNVFNRAVAFLTRHGRELSAQEKVPVMRAYLKGWKCEVGVFFDGVGPDSSDAEILAIAGKHPAFEVLPVR
jgi:hypothetical protein